MKQACFYSLKNNPLNANKPELPVREDEGMSVLHPQKKSLLKKWNYILTFCLAIVLSSSVFAIDLNVTGITGAYSDANGIYHSQGILARSGVQYWKHESKEYYIYYDEYQTETGWYYWYLDIDTDDEDSNIPNGSIAYSDEDPSTVSPAGITMYDGALANGTTFPMTIAEYSTIPEINITGNGTSISSGNTTPLLNNHTKFGSANISGGNASRMFTIQNTGSVDPLTVGTISFSGTNASEFTVTSSPSPSVNASSETTFTVTFKPTGVGDRTATISIGNNDSNENPYTFAISGYGFTPKNLVISGSTNPPDLNGTYTYQGIKNDFQYWKHSTLDYYIWYNSSSWIIDNNFLSSDGYPFYSVSEANMPTGLTWSTNSFLPTGGSSYSVGAGTVTVSEEVSVPEINVKVGQFSIPDGTTTTSFYKNTNFGSLEVTSGERVKSFTIENTGNTALTLSGSSPYITISGANASDFSITTIPSNSIAASGTTTFGITFNPSATGTRNAIVIISSNDEDEAEYTFAIKGEGVVARNLVVSDITAPSAANGTYIYQGILNEFQYWKHQTENYYIFNSPYNGTDPVWYIDVDQNATPITPSSYTFYSQTEYASPVNVPNWTPSTGNAGTPSIVYTEPEIKVTGNSINILNGDNTPSLFDYTDLGWVVSGSISKTFTIENTGIAALNLTGTSPYITFSGANASQFSITSAPAATIAAEGSTTFEVTFTPSSNTLGSRTATLAIGNDDADENPYTFLVQSGVGTLPVITTQATANIGTTNAICNGSITTLGSPNPTSYGICYGTTANPDITGSKVDKGTAIATGAFTAQLAGLTPGTTYYARAFATNNVETVYGDDVTFTTTATMTAPGNALNFDGTNDYVNLGDKIEGLTTLTIETWVYYASDGSSTYDEIFSKENVNSLNIWRGGGDKVWFHLGTGTTWFDGGQIVSNSSIPKDRWTHIAVTWDQATTTVKIYINGVLDKTALHTHSGGSVMGSNSALRGIGGYPVVPGHPFKGKLDELRVWNVVRSQAEIQSDMVTAISSSAGLLCSFNFDEGTAGGNNTAGTTILTDLTGNGNNGTLTNFARTGTTSNWVESYAMVVPTIASETDLSSVSFTANWTAPAIGTVNNYLLEVATDAAFTAPVSGSPFTIASPTLTKAINGLASNANYYYRVRADKTSVTGEGAWSGTKSVTTYPTSTIFQTNGNWSDKTNWSAGLPGATTDVTIAANCNIDGNYTVKDVTVNAGQQVTIASGSTLTASGNLILKSDNAGTASLIGTTTVAGTTSAECYLTGGKWHVVSPIAAGGSISTFIQITENAIPVNGSSQYGMMDYNEATNLWKDYFTASTSGNLTSGQGYSLRRSADGVVTFSGTLFSGTKTVSLTKLGEGWNCIGNPYTSAIGMNSLATSTENFLTKNSGSLESSYACVYVWDPTSSTYQILGNLPTGLPSERSLVQNYLQSGQGFFVKAKDAASSIQFSPAMQSHQTSVEFKSATTAWSTVTLKASSNQTSTSAILAFNNQMTKGLDPTYDAGLLRGTNGLSLYTKLVDDNGVDFAIQCLPETGAEQMVIPVGLESKVGGEVRFSAVITSLPAGCTVLLEDRVAKTVTDLSDGKEMVATVSANTAGTGRFYLHMSKLTTGNDLTPEASFNLKAYVSGEQIVIEGRVSGQAKASLYDSKGSQLGLYNLEEGTRNAIPATGLSSGLYILKVTDGKNAFTSKLVINSNR